MKSNKELYAVIIGLILGIVSNFLLGGVFLSSVIVISGILIWRNSAKEDRSFLKYIFISGIIIRIIIYLVYANISILSGKGGWLTGDSYGTYNYAWLYVQKLKGSRVFLINSMDTGMVYDDSQDFYNYFGGSYEKIINSFTYGNYGFTGFTMILGYLFYIFGPMKFSGRLVNIFFGTLSGIFIYYIVKSIFGQKSAKISSVLVTFFPSIFIWSLDFLKDPLYILLSIVILWSFVMYWNANNFLYIALIFIATLIQITVRRDLWLIGLIPFSLGFLLLLRISFIKKIVFITAIIVAASAFFINRGINYTSIKTKIASALQNHIGHVNTGGYCYKILNDKYYAPTNYNINNITWYEALKAFLNGWWHFLFEPFVWGVKSKSMVMVFPQMILWYVLLIFALVGIAFGLRYNWKYTCIITSYIFLLSSVIAFAGGNIGTLFRHRDIVTPFYLIFSSVGIMHLLEIIQSNALKRGANTH